MKSNIKTWKQVIYLMLHRPHVFVHIFFFKITEADNKLALRNGMGIECKLGYILADIVSSEAGRI